MLVHVDVHLGVVRVHESWIIVRADVKKLARLNCIKYVLSQIDYIDKAPMKALTVDPKIIISGIDELKMMEDNLMRPKSLPG